MSTQINMADNNIPFYEIVNSLITNNDNISNGLINIANLQAENKEIAARINALLYAENADIRSKLAAQRFYANIMCVFLCVLFVVVCITFIHG